MQKKKKRKGKAYKIKKYIVPYIETISALVYDQYKPDAFKQLSGLSPAGNDHCFNNTTNINSISLLDLNQIS